MSFSNAMTTLQVGTFSFLLLLRGTNSAVGETLPSQCREIERPEENGDPVIIIPSGVIPEIGPLEVADRIREGTSLMRAGHGRAKSITCLEYLPAEREAPSSSNQARGRWVAHVEASFWFKPPFAEGGCRSSHGLVRVPDTKEAFAGGGITLLEPRICSGLESRLMKAR